MSNLVVIQIGSLIQAGTNGLFLGLTLGLVAGGLALIWGISDIVNFAHGEYLLIGMYTAAFASQLYGIDPLIMIPFNAILLFVIGYLTYTLVISKAMDSPMLAQIFVTFGILLVLQYGFLMVFGPFTEGPTVFWGGNGEIFGVFFSYEQVVTGTISLIAIVVLYVFMMKSKTGAAIRATAQDRQAARVMGIDPDYIMAVSWGLGLSVVGIAGTVLASFFPIRPLTTPITWTLWSFVAVALGGFGNVFAAVIGGLIVGMVQEVSGVVLNPGFTQLYVFVMFILVLLFFPNGIINWRE